LISIRTTNFTKQAATEEDNRFSFRSKSVRKVKPGKFWIYRFLVVILLLIVMLCEFYKNFVAALIFLDWNKINLISVKIPQDMGTMDTCCRINCRFPQRRVKGWYFCLMTWFPVRKWHPLA